MIRDPTVSVVQRHAVELEAESAASRIAGAIDERASLVLIGGATRGTHEFYRLRAAVTRRLIEERGFGIVGVEADWPDAYRANRWARHLGDDETAEAALGDFTRFPRWMWRNREVERFLKWLRAYNTGRPFDARAGFYGLDFYGLHRSIAGVLDYLDKVDPGAARLARVRYACLDISAGDPKRYGDADSARFAQSREDQVVSHLVDLQRTAADCARRDGRIAADEYSAAEQHARLIGDAAAYYRAMFRGGAESWNLRARHMLSTLEALLEHAAQSGPPARAVIWTHNSHLGDARATGLAVSGELNLGQLVRQEYGSRSCLMAMATHVGGVTAAREWGAPPRSCDLPPSLDGSYERLFHDTGIPIFLLRMAVPPVWQMLGRPRLERAIGAVYTPETERASHYRPARLSEQVDLVVHVDETRALEPLEEPARHRIDVAETYPRTTLRGRPHRPPRTDSIPFAE